MYQSGRVKKGQAPLRRHKMLPLVVIIVAIIIGCCFLKNRRQIIAEGIIIGVVSGICISYVTDVNFQARVNGPFYKVAHTFNKKIRYISNAWANIKIEKLSGNKYTVRATNTVSGNTVEFTNVHVNTIPASLRYQIVTSDAELQGN